ncbi:MAG: Txe/YoeB family addiction module toxin [Bacteroidales bacterium]|nr:Txe/YoeB family addiction module toxin [Bacteroidales bacterium]
MKYQLLISDEAKKGLELWKSSGQKNVLEKIAHIFEELETHPFTGTGHPELLRGALEGKWSRRIDKKNRIVYSVKENILQVEIITVIGHYGDK